MEKKNSSHSIFILFKNCILSLSRKDKKKLIFSILILIFGSILSAFVQIIFKNILNNINIDNNIITLSIISLIALYSIIWIFNQISNILTWLSIESVIITISKKIILDLFQYTLHMEYFVFLNNDTKNINNYFETIFNTISNIFSNLIIHIIPALIEMIIAFIFFFYLYGFFYAILLVLLLVSFFYFTYISISTSKKLDIQYYKALDIFHIHLLQAITHIEIIKTYYSYDFEYKKMEEILSNFFGIAKKRNIKLDRAQAFQIISCGIILCIFTFLSYLSLLKKKILLGDFVLINNYFLQFTIPITFLGYIFSELYKNIILLKKSFLILNFPQQKNNIVKNHSLDMLNPLIIFNKVSFIINEKIILNSISFQINPQEKIAIIGTSGSGKSTLLKLLMKLHTPSRGNIFFNNIDIEAISQEEIYNYMTIATQNSYIFFGTIADNIRYNQNNISDEEIITILKKLKLYDKIKNFKNNIYTLVEELNLSEGEKQRITLARALLRKSNIFFFDEISSSLDSKMEHEIKEYLDDFLIDKTAIFVTHRLLFAQNVNKIIVMKNGKIESIGNHNELYNSCTEYKKIYSEQCEI